MKKQNIAEEVIECCIDQDFNPDIVLVGVREAYEVGKVEGFRKGFAIGFGIWTVSLGALSIAVKIAKKRKKKKQEREELEERRRWWQMAAEFRPEECIKCDHTDNCDSCDKIGERVVGGIRKNSGRYPWGSTTIEEE